MKILLVHNSHRSGSASGDDGVFKREGALLENHGHQVIRYNPSNDGFYESGPIGKLYTALQFPWSLSAARHIRDLARKEKPNLAHVHNFFPLISPSIYHTLNAEGIPVVQTLHDFRFLCAMAFFMRDGIICEKCKKGSVFRGVWHGCFKESRIGTIPVALMLKLHQYLDTFRKRIDAYVCLTKSQRKIFSEAGFDENKLFVKPNYVEDISGGNETIKGDYAVFIGRLGEEKGVKTLIEAWRSLKEVPLKVIGDGPDGDKSKKMVHDFGIKNIEFLGFRPHSYCMSLLDGARFLVMPSIWYETFGLTIIEAFSHEKPVITSNLGAMADLVADHKTGLLLKPGNPDDLRDMVRLLWENPGECIRMGKNARREYEEKYTPEKNFEMLMAIYKWVIERKGGTGAA